MLVQQAGIVARLVGRRTTQKYMTDEFKGGHDVG
jgi:hypothetical protein